MSTARRAAGAAKTPGQLFGLVFGAVYVLVGILGFIDPLVGDDDRLLGIFGITPLHNVAHLAVGALLLFGSRAPDTARIVNLVVGIVYLLLGVLGLFGFLIEDGQAIDLNNNAAGTVLHFATAALALYFGTAGSGDDRTTSTA
ncbi:MAG: DUF4383 domain-containing protein [Actinobacteria bacterium]|nr:DUF4383 domain-containing protein [Actinomycetota bacterium]